VKWPGWLTGPLAAPPDAELPFDTTIDLGPRNVPGTDAGPAMAAVREAARALPGVHRVSVGRHDGLGGTTGLWVRVCPPGGGVMPKTASWQALKARVEAAAMAALTTLVPASLDYEMDHVHRASGFADGAAYAPVPLPFRPPPAELTRITGPAPASHAQIASGDAAGLDDPALAAALLSLVLPADPTVLAGHLVTRFGSFAAILSAPVLELQAVSGLGPHCVAAIKLIHATALRASQAGLMHRPVLDDMVRLTDYLAAVLARERIEQFRILFLDDQRRLIADEAQARGTVNHTPVYPREVVRRAIELRAAHLVLVHNHPSGDPTPSREDVEMTGMVRDAAALLGIGVQDHIIVGNGQWTSFRAAGLL